MFKSALFWFRRDLRVEDNAGLTAALQQAERVLCVFVFDTDILDRLPDRADRRVEFIHASVEELKANLCALGGDLLVCHGSARQSMLETACRLGVDAVFTNEDYEPDARARDANVATDLQRAGIRFLSFKDTVIFAKDEVLTQAGTPFTVFTPYKRRWLLRLTAEADAALAACDPAEALQHLASLPTPSPMPTLAAIGFRPAGLPPSVRPGAAGATALLEDFATRLDHYRETRDFPAVKGVSYLSVHNRFGTVSLRALARLAWRATLAGTNSGAETWLGELIWRDFWFQLLWHHPHVVSRSFKPEFVDLPWHNDETLFVAWCEARTGFPLVDAAIRQLNTTGWMHNRLRMVVASFLTKDLLVDWRWGERIFAERLIDFDLAANNGGWQWAASTGCDAQPWFRIFNPVTQSERFDPQGRFIRRYLPELDRVPLRWLHAPWTMPPLEQQAAGIEIGRDYPLPVVDHARQRERALALFKSASKGATQAGV